MYQAKPSVFQYTSREFNSSISESSSLQVSDSDLEAAIKLASIQTINTDGWIVFDTQINMFLNTKTEVSARREVVTSQFVFTDLCLHDECLLVSVCARIEVSTSEKGEEKKHNEINK